MGSKTTGKPKGRPSDYTDEIAAKICYELSIGRSLRKICLADDMPCVRTVHVWLLSKTDFMHQYTQAREIQADTIFDECIDIADTEDNDMQTVDGQERVNSDVIARDRLRIDTRKWMAGKLRPKKYGDKTIHSNDPDNPMPAVGVIERVIVKPDGA